MPGRSADDIIDGGAGGEFSRALMLFELDGMAETVRTEFMYDDGDPAKELYRLVLELQAHLNKLSVTVGAELTLHRYCEACGGVDPHGCEECDGDGYVVPPVACSLWPPETM